MLKCHMKIYFSTQNFPTCQGMIQFVFLLDARRKVYKISFGRREKFNYFIYWSAVSSPRCYNTTPLAFHLQTNSHDRAAFPLTFRVIHLVLFWYCGGVELPCNIFNFDISTAISFSNFVSIL